VRRALTYVAAWGGATSLAVLLVWFGARPVLDTAVFGSPPARSVVPPPSTPAPAIATPTPATGRPAPGRTAHAARSRPPRHPVPSPTASARSYTLTGGQVVLSMTNTAARLVSATPASGYEVRTWHAPGWLRVDFSQGGHTSSLFATWNGHPPAVQITG
jgi:hypothetical protein